MVLSAKFGKPRAAAMVFWLSTVTVGVYWFYWAYRSQNELYRQFELSRENRDEGAVWLIFGGFLPFLRYIFYHHYVANTRYLRERFGFAKSLSPGGFLGLSLTAGGIFTALGLVAVIMISNSLARDPFTGGVMVRDGDLLAIGLAIAGVASLQWVVLKFLALRALQSDVNEIWQAYDDRARQMLPAAFAPASPPKVPTARPPSLPTPVKGAAPQSASRPVARPTAGLVNRETRKPESQGQAPPR